MEQVFCNGDISATIFNQLNYISITNFIEAYPVCIDKFEKYVTIIHEEYDQVYPYYLTKFYNVINLTLINCSIYEIELLYFYRLKTLDLSSNDLTEINLDHLISLEKLDISYNHKLKLLNVQNNKKLLKLDITSTLIDKNSIIGLNKKTEVVDLCSVLFGSKFSSRKVFATLNTVPIPTTNRTWRRLNVIPFESSFL